MNGDFKGDFSRDSFGILRDFASVRDLTYSLLQDSSGKKDSSILRDFSLLSNFSRLLWQQGRVILDADLNEQIDILLHYLRSLARDLIGPQGGPIYHDDASNQDYTGFALYTSSSDKGKLHIRLGHYYVDGILIRNEQDIAYADQPYSPPATTDSLTSNKNGYLAYLDVWERQVTSLENDLIREFALGEGGPDTATRAQLVWQEKTLNLDDSNLAVLYKTIVGINDEKGVDRYQNVNTLKEELEELLQSRNRGRLAAMAKETTDEDQNNACIIPPASSYRGPENQLYRVEIHTGGPAWPDTAKTKAASGSGGQGATFVVSRENGSVLFPILSAQTGDNNTVTVTLDDLGRDDSRFTLNKNDWVEIVYEDNVLMGVPGPLYQISTIDTIAMTVTLTPAKNAVPPDFTKKLLLRLWNYRGSRAKNPKAGEAELADDGALKVKENTWFQLENGIQIQFQPAKESPEPGALAYRTGDYWLIPARTVTGDVIWPQLPQPPASQGNPERAPLPPHGVRHHYAPLAYITVDANGDVSVATPPLQYTFKSLVVLSL